METPELISAAFWESTRPHIAQPEPSLDAFLVTRFPGQGISAFQTSGSESSPKWVLLEKRAFLISAEAVNRHFAATAEDRWLITIPSHHVGGFSIFARAFLSGASVTQSSAKWDPVKFTAQLESDAITLTSLVPTQVYDLVLARLTPPPNLRAIAVGGGGMGIELARNARNLGWPVFQSYGMTETASQIATQPLAPDSPATTLEVLPIWNLTTEPDNRLTVRGPALAIGYAQRNASGGWTVDPIDPSVGLRTRDRVRLWTEGDTHFLEFQGRDQDWIKILGELVYVPPLQTRLDDLATSLGWPTSPILLALPDERAENRLILVADHTQPEPTELIARYNDTVSTPIHRISAAGTVPEIPRSDLGKVQRAELLKRLHSGPPQSDR